MPPLNVFPYVLTCGTTKLYTYAFETYHCPSDNNKLAASGADSKQIHQPCYATKFHPRKYVTNVFFQKEKKRKDVRDELNYPYYRDMHKIF